MTTPIRIAPQIPAAVEGCAQAHCCAPEAPAAAPSPAATGNTSPARFRISTMDCAVEEAEIRRSLAALSGIRTLTFDLPRRTLALEAEPAVVEQALRTIRKSGFDPQPLADDAGREEAARHHHDDHDHAHPHAHDAAAGDGRWRLGLALLLAIAAEAVELLAPGTRPWQALGMLLAAAAIAACGLAVYRKGLVALRHGRLNINALMAVAVSGAFVIGQWPEAAMVMALYAIAEAIEGRAVDRARHAIQRLMALAPDIAAVRQGDGSWHDTPVAAVPLQALLRVRPGERVPLDGVVAAGRSAIDQSPVTGESLPVDKAAGDPVFAGTINQSGLIEVRVTAAASDSTLARILHAVERAQASRAPMQGFVERFAAVYTPAVFVLALAVAALGPWLVGWGALQAVYKALVLLVIACPCALVISTPVTIVSALAAAARRGVLIKGGVHLEAARRLAVVAFDKTGTLTEGRPRLVSWEPAAPAADRASIARLAAALAGHSDHPVSVAIARGLDLPIAAATDFEVLPGRGVQARIDGTLLVLGNRRLIEERGQLTPALQAQLQALEHGGGTFALLASPAEVLASFVVADTIKPTAREAVAALKALGLTPVMLSGDHQSTASAIAREAGIDRAQGDLLPDDKLAAIRRLQAEHGPTAMIGDGINDAPALAQADIGVAMGAAGTDIAIEAADVVVMNDDLRRVAETVRLSRMTQAVLWQNIVFALGIKGVFLLLALAGQATMWMAVFADMGASLLVVVNGLRLLRGVAGSAGPR